MTTQQALVRDEHRSNPSRARLARRLSGVSAVSILVGGYVHFCLYRHGYEFIPKIGVSFLVQSGSSVALAAALLVVAWVTRTDRFSIALAQLTRLSAIGLSIGTLGALGLTHTHAGLFQFHEIGLMPAPQTVIAILAESVAVTLLSVAVLQAHASLRAPQPATVVASPDSNRAVRDAA